MADITPPRIDSVIQVSERRRLAYAEYGDPDGDPILLFHGLPGSRLAWGLIPGSPFPQGLRLIALDRPGYGRSDPKPGRIVLDWAKDVTKFVDILGIEKFAALGVSGGGPGALACAWAMPERLTSVGVVSSPAPSHAPGVFEGMSKTNRFFMKMAWHLPGLSTINLKVLASVIRRNPAAYIKSMQFKVHDVDKAILRRPEVMEMLTKDFTEALGGGSHGMVEDLLANHGRPWGFALNEISIRVQNWFCEYDLSVPPAMGRYLGNSIPNSDSTFVRGAGHLWIIEHLNDVLHRLTFDQHDSMKA